MLRQEHSTVLLRSYPLDSESKLQIFQYSLLICCAQCYGCDLCEGLLTCHVYSAKDSRGDACSTLPRSAITSQGLLRRESWDPREQEVNTSFSSDFAESHRLCCCRFSEKPAVISLNGKSGWSSNMPIRSEGSYAEESDESRSRLPSISRKRAPPMVAGKRKRFPRWPESSIGSIFGRNQDDAQNHYQTVNQFFLSPTRPQHPDESFPQGRQIRDHWDNIWYR